MIFEKGQHQCWGCGEEFAPYRYKLVQGFSPGDYVFCRCPRGCNYGSVGIAEPGDLDRYLVQVAARERRRLDELLAAARDDRPSDRPFAAEDLKAAGPDRVPYDGILAQVDPELAALKNKITARDQKLVAGTVQGAYSLNFGLPAPASVTINNVAGNLNISWLAVPGAVGYKVYYGSSYQTLAVIDAGNVLSTTISALGVNIVIVSGYNADGYESVVRHWFVSNGDTTPPAKISDLTVSQISDTEMAISFTVPVDRESAITEFDVRYRTSAITALNFASSSQVVGEPLPKAQGTRMRMVIPNLTSATSYYFAIRTKNSSGKWSLISNVVNLATLEPGLRKITLAWDPNAEANIAGYVLYKGMDVRMYDESKDLCLANINPASPTCDFLVERGFKYHFAATAYNTNNVSSGFSEELVCWID